DQGSFTGREAIEVVLTEASREIECHAAELEITGATLRRAGGSSAGAGGSSAGAGGIDLAVELRPGEERVAFVAPEKVGAGEYVLSCSFAGPLNDKLRGFYRSRFEDPSGNERLMAVTHFESHDARRAFPCFDEPDRKAVFGVSLEVKADLFTVSNASVRQTTTLDDGHKRVEFEDTPVMSTYLVCFAAGPLESSNHVRAAGVPIGVVAPVGRSHLTGFALDVAAHALDWFASYFALPYPGDKLDLLDVPDFAMGAMENLGCVTFRETDLLCDPEQSSVAESFRIANVIEHELAHMWFGDLVTMKWWDGIWLNEAFATFMSQCCIDDFRPDWHGWVVFGQEKDMALEVDGLHTTRAIEYPVRWADEAEAMFDALTYLKGGNVLRMVQQYVGEERFRDGVRRYLREHQFANTEAGELWSALETEAADVPVADLMHSWILQGGFPLVTARRREGTIELEAEPFSYLRASEWAEHGGGRPSGIGTSWLVPVSVAERPGGAGSGGAGSGGARVETVLIGAGGTNSVRLEAGTGGTGGQGGTGLRVVNAGGAGAFRVRYEGELLGEIVSNLDRLTALERFNLVSDTWAVALARMGPLDDYISLTRRLAGEIDPNVWALVTRSCAILDIAVADSDRPALALYVRSLLAPELETIGWDAAEGEAPEIPRSRAAFITALGTIGEDPAVVEHAEALFSEAAGARRPLPPGIAEAVLRVVAARADRGIFDAFMARVQRPLDPLDGERHLFALSGLKDLELVFELQELCRHKIRTQDAPYLLNGLLRNRTAGPSTWRFIDSNWQELQGRYASGALPTMISGLSRLADIDSAGTPVMAGEIRDDLARRDLGGHRRVVDQHLERLAVNVAFVRQHRRSLGEVLASA
ncbi:MAG: M1 family aminopeptidase, partial [Acidimicrobiales bacterium]